MIRIPPLEGKNAEQALEDMALIARGEELDLPWRRLRILLDHEFVEIVSPVWQGGAHRGSVTSLGWTEKGSLFMNQGASGAVSDDEDANR